MQFTAPARPYSDVAIRHIRFFTTETSLLTFARNPERASKLSCAHAGVQFVEQRLPYKVADDVEFHFNIGSLRPF